MNNNLLSVIVPVYNTGQYLKTCIQSLLDQDYPQIEILLIDDGSNDHYTRLLCDTLAIENENVISYHKSNGGSASARNYGIQRAKGKYIGFIDSDDVIEPNMFSSLYHDIITNNVQVALGGISTEENGELIDRVPPIPTGVYDRNSLLHYFFLGSFHSSCTNLYEKSLFENISFPENEVNEDYMLNYWIFKTLDKVSVNETPFYHYVRREGSNTSSPASLKFLDWIKHTKLVLEEMKNETRLRKEAEYQYLYSNIILANKALYTLSRSKSKDADMLYKTSVCNLRKDKLMLNSNPFLIGRYLRMGQAMTYFPYLYKKAVICALMIKNKIK